MNTMSVLRFNDSSDAPGWQFGTAPVPQHQPGQILIRVRAAGVTPTELQWYPTIHTANGERRLGAVPGHEFSGEIVAVGEGGDPQQVGREVFGMND